MPGRAGQLFIITDPNPAVLNCDYCLLNQELTETPFLLVHHPPVIILITAAVGEMWCIAAYR